MALRAEPQEQAEDDGWEPTPPDRLIRARLVGSDDEIKKKGFQMSPRPTRNQISRKKPMPIWRVPLTGAVTPRLQKPQPTGSVVDAIGFQRLEEGANWGGAWVRNKDRPK
jgi:hypothetical protein